MRKLIVLSFLSVFLALPVQALDPVCDPNDPAFGTPHDPATTYVREETNVRFCSSLDTPEAPIVGQMTCRVTVDGNPYALSSTVDPGTEVVVDVTERAGEVTAECEANILGGDGNQYVRTSDMTVTQYVHVPVPEPPVFLED